MHKRNKNTQIVSSDPLIIQTSRSYPREVEAKIQILPSRDHCIFYIERCVLTSPTYISGSQLDAIWKWSPERFLIDICDISFLGFDKSQLKKQQLGEQTKEILSMFIYM